MKLFDLHCDTLTVCEAQNQALYHNDCHFDIHRASALCEAWVQTMAVYIADNTPFDTAWQYAVQVLEYLHHEAETTRGLTIVRSADDLQRCRCGILPAIENGIVIGTDLAKVEQLAQYGIVYMTITWNGSNPLGNGCLSGNPDGLTKFGKTAVEKFYHVGILPDVSHLNAAGFWDVVQCSNGRPFLASHSVSDAVHHHPRNLTDAQFGAIRANGGLVGLNGCEAQLGAQTFEQMERHLYHFWSLDGEDTVALGMDLDGTELPSEWHGVELFPRFYEYLLKKQYPQALIQKLFFENSYAFFMKTLTSRDKCIRIGT